MARSQAEIEHELECRAMLGRELPTDALLRDFDITQLTHRVVWVSDEFEVGIEIDGAVDAAALEDVLRRLVRVSVMDRREVAACVAAWSS